MYRKDRVGFMPKLVTRIYNERKEYKKTMLQKKQELVDIKERNQASRTVNYYQACCLLVFTILGTAIIIDPVTQFIFANPFMIRGGSSSHSTIWL